MRSSSPTETSPEPHIPLAADAEPGPYWPVAKQLWRIAWEFHWAGFGVLFSALAVHSFLVLAQAKTRQGFGRNPLFYYSHKRFAVHFRNNARLMLVFVPLLVR